MSLRKVIPAPVLPYWRAYRQRRSATVAVKRAFYSADGPPILVYQMGKVGSTTVCRSLEAVNLGHRVLHVHFLSHDLPAKRKRYIRSIKYPPAIHYDVSFAVRKELATGQTRRLKIITLVRDPISRLVSSLYEVPELMDADVKTDSGTIDPVKSIEFLERRLAEPGGLEYEYTWFDKELKSVFGIDVFADPFPKEQGWRTINDNEVEVLMMRLEDLSRVGPRVIADFLDLQGPLDLISGRVRSHSVSGASYADVRQSLSISRHVTEQVYGSEFVRHFYSDDMIDEFMDRWQSPNRSPFRGNSDENYYDSP